MDSKITLPRLAALLAQSTGKSKKFCEDFLRILFTTIADSLYKGEAVKVKGFGTFKLVRVEERKSVNVSTGEEYVIPAHDKLNFIPSKELAAKVNSPFAMFETVELSDLISEEELESVAKSDDSDELDESNRSNRSDRSDRLDRSDESNQSNQSNRSDRSDRLDQSDETYQSDRLD
ncbi:MAG: HU family DNA-binding protein, partial [Clostridium sp.]|nr:HU family DNA-binding protein [Prevotella sp.]MCM1428212.1 HU family DNA-binding protein [Clostridium sp.]